MVMLSKQFRNQVVASSIITAFCYAIVAVIPFFAFSFPDFWSFKKENTALTIACIKIFLAFFILINTLWLLHYQLFRRINKKWAETWRRATIPFCLNMILPFAFNPHFYTQYNYGNNQIILRIINVIIINLMVFHFFELILKKFAQQKLYTEIKDLTYLQLEAKYLLEKGQVNHHFLFNTLNSINEQVVSDPLSAQKTILNLATLLRNIHQIEGNFLSIKEELALTNDFLQIQQVRFPKGFNINIDIPMNQMGKKIPFFTIITLLENVFKHNIISEMEPLAISIYMEDDYLFVKNDKKIKQAISSNNSGLENLNNRCKFLTDNYIAIIDELDFFMVKIKTVANQN